MARATSFKKVVLCHTNDFKNDLNEKIKIWVEANGGCFRKELTADVTHLISSKKAWKRYYPLVKQARRMRTVHIVTYDWLEDSLLNRPVRALPEVEYLFERNSHKAIKKAKQKRRSAPCNKSENKSPKRFVPRDKRVSLTGIEFDKAKSEFEQDMGSAGFHPYSDSTGFVYIISLLRYDILREYFEKFKLKVGHDPPSLPYAVVPGVHVRLHLLPAPEPYSSSPIVGYGIRHDANLLPSMYIAKPWAQSLQLYESDDRPHTYACYIQYTRRAVQKQVAVLAPPGSTWDFAWTAFRKFFLKKVATPWDQRSRAGSEINLDGNQDNSFYQYQAPATGELEGLWLDADILQVANHSTTMGEDPEKQFQIATNETEDSYDHRDGEEEQPEIERDDSHLP